ncbi:hypothetical protein [Streptomyces sp. bgisy027]
MQQLPQSFRVSSVSEPEAMLFGLLRPARSFLELHQIAPSGLAVP